MSDEEKLRSAIDGREFVGSTYKLCDILIAEIRRLRAELAAIHTHEEAKALAVR